MSAEKRLLKRALIVRLRGVHLKAIQSQWKRGEGQICSCPSHGEDRQERVECKRNEISQSGKINSFTPRGGQSHSQSRFYLVKIGITNSTM